MSKIYKMEMYLVEPENVLFDTMKDKIERINDREDFWLVPFNVKEKEIEWRDEIDLNFKNQPKEVYEKYFKGE